MAEIRAQFGRAEPEAQEGTNYGAPGRAMRLRPVLRLPQRHTLEAATLPALDAPDDAFGEAYDAALEMLDDPWAARAHRQ